MNLPKTLLLALGALTLAACGGGGSEPREWPGPDPDPTPTPAASASLVHVALPANTTGDRTRIDHPLANDDPDAYVIVTPNWIPGDMGLGVYVNHPYGVRYLGGRWQIEMTDHADVPAAAAFNVTVAAGPNAGATAFGIHRTTPDNIDVIRSFIDHPAANSNPAAVILITYNASAGSTPFDHPTGLVYDDVRNRWAIYNRDSARMEEDVAFNFAVVGTGPASPFTLGTYVVNDATAPAMDLGLPEDPDAIVHVTPVFDPVVGVAYQRHYGVAYIPVSGGWVAFNQNATEIRGGVAFHAAVARP